MKFDDLDELYGSGLDPKYIGWSTQCPVCGVRGDVDDVNEARVIIRHDATTWHVVPDMAARRILWDRGMRPPPKRRAVKPR